MCFAYLLHSHAVCSFQRYRFPTPQEWNTLRSDGSSVGIVVWDQLPRFKTEKEVNVQIWEENRKEITP